MISTKNHFLKKSLKDKYFLNKLKFLDGVLLASKTHQYNRCKHDWKAQACAFHSMLRVENRVYANVHWDRFSFDNSRTHSHLMRSRQKIVGTVFLAKLKIPASSVNPNTSQNSSLKKPKFFLHQTFKTLNKKKQPLDSLFQLRKILTQMDQNGISFGEDLSLPIKHRILLKRSYFLAGILCLNLNNKRKELYGVSYWNQQWLFNEFFDWLFSSILGHCVENILIKYGKKSNVQKERFKELYLTYCSLSASFLDVLEPVEMENLLKVECLFFNKTNLLRQIRLILHIYHPWFFKTLTKKQQFNFFKTIITKTYEIGSYHYIKKLFSLTHDLEGRLIVDNLTFSFELTNTQNNFNNFNNSFSSRENNFKPSVSWVLMVGFFLSYASWRFFFANNTRFVTPFSTFNPNIVTVSLALQSNTEISKLPFAAMTTYTSKTKNKQENTNARQTNYLIPSNSSCVQSSASSQVFKSSLAGSKNTSALTPGQPPLLFKTSDFAKSPMRSNLVQNQSGSALKATLTASAIDDPTRPRTVVVSLGITLDEYRSATMQNQLDKQSQLGVSVPTKNQLYLILGYDPAKATWSHVLLPCTLQVNPNKPEESGFVTNPDEPVLQTLINNSSLPIGDFSIKNSKLQPVNTNINLNNRLWVINPYKPQQTSFSFFVGYATKNSKKTKAVTTQTIQEIAQYISTHLKNPDEVFAIYKALTQDPSTLPAELATEFNNKKLIKKNKNFIKKWTEFLIKKADEFADHACSTTEGAHILNKKLQAIIGSDYASAGVIDTTISLNRTWGLDNPKALQPTTRLEETFTLEDLVPHVHEIGCLTYKKTEHDRLCGVDNKRPLSKQPTDPGVVLFTRDYNISMIKEAGKKVCFCFEQPLFQAINNQKQKNNVFELLYKSILGKIFQEAIFELNSSLKHLEEALSASKDLLSVLTTYNTSSQSRETILNFVSKQKIIETKLTNFIKALDHSLNLGHHIQASAVLSCFSFSMLTECSYEDYTMLTDTVIALIKNSDFNTPSPTEKLSNTQQFKLTQQLKPTDPFDFTSSFGLTLQKKGSKLKELTLKLQSDVLAINECLYMYNNLLNSHISNQAESNQSSVAVALSKNLCDKLLIKLNKNANLSIFQYNSLELRTSLNELYKKILEKPEYKQYQEADISAKHEFVPQIIEHVNQITKIPEYSDFLKQKYLTGNFYNDSIPKNPLSFNQKSSKPRLASEPARNQELALAIVEQPASKPRSASDLTNPTWADRVRLGRQPAEKKSSKPRLASEPARNQELALAIVEQPASKPRSASDLTNPTWADRVRLGRQPAEKKT